MSVMATFIAGDWSSNAIRALVYHKKNPGTIVLENDTGGYAVVNEIVGGGSPHWHRVSIAELALDVRMYLGMHEEK